MPNWAETTRQGLERWFTGLVDPAGPSWSDRIGLWLLERMAGGLTKSLEDMEPGAIEGYGAGLDAIIANPLVPEEVKVFLRKSNTPGNPISAVAGMLVMVLQSFGVLLGGSQPISNILQYEQDKALKTSRLDPLSVITEIRRNPTLGTAFLEDLREQGWTDERIQVLQEITEFLPSADEQTLWLAREVFEPDQVLKYGLDDELPVYANTDFSKVGVSPGQMRNKWRAHWEHSSYIQMVEMFRRKLITREDFSEWFRLVEIAPFWREDLIEISQAWPTRVDVRRWWDMRTIDEQRLRVLYQGMGYEGQNLEDYVLWTKVFTDAPVIFARWNKGWITIDDVRDQLIGLGMPAARVDQFIQEKVQAEQPERTSKERDITKTDIYKGVKQERITRGQGLELLQDLGYDMDEADYLLSINIPEDNVASVEENRLLSKADILAGLRTGQITEAEARTRLQELRYSAVDTTLILNIFKASISPPDAGILREASKADIVKGVKKGLIDREEGYLRLIDIGFEPTAADFILFVQVEESPFSPVDFSEFKAITSKWRKATAMTTPQFQAKIREARDDLVQITDEVKSLEEAVRAEGQAIINVDIVPDETKARLVELNVALNRARSEKNRLQAAFDTLVAEFKQTSE